MALPGGLSVPTLFGGAMLLLGTGILVVSGRYVWRATTVLRATKQDTLADAAPGTLVRVAGTISQGDEGVLVAPFSEVACVALRYQIEERRLSPLYLLPWYVTVHEATGAVGFTVRTAAGTVPVVEPVRTVALTTQIVETTSATAEPPERIENFETEHTSVPDSTVWQNPPALVAPIFRALSIGTRRYSERRAARGEDVTVAGRVTNGGSGIDPIVVSDRSPVATVFRTAKTSIGGLLIGLGGLLLGSFLLFLG